MLVRPSFSQRRAGSLALFVSFFFFFSALIYTHDKTRTYISSQLPRWKTPVSGTQPAEEEQEDLPLPGEYDATWHESEFCEERFSTTYLQNIRNHATSYCEDGSASSLTCFHSITRSDGLPDSMCIGQGAVLNMTSGKWDLSCQLRQLEAERVERGEEVPLEQLKGYWYDTGPGIILNKFVETNTSHRGLERVRLEDPDISSRHPRFHLLLKREGETNPWHCLMEIWSTWMTFDVLRMARDPRNNHRPVFQHPEDAHDTQVVILDDRADGPYWDLWTLFAERTPIRLHEMLADPTARSDTNIIVPLAGASNPLWENDWEVRDCSTASTLRTFSRRVLEHYGITNDPPRDPSEIVVTFVDRKDSRRLQDQDALFDALRAKVPHIRVQFVDFASLPFSEQVRVVRDTDVLVGVHGAGLTHTMFMREGAGAVVELQPEPLHHKGFRNLANMLRLDYYRIHAAMVGSEDEKKQEQEQVEEQGKPDEVLKRRGGRAAARVARRDDWHSADVRVERERFLEVMDVAVKSLYAKGIWNFDVI